jgi:membrane complex biogenesis BtpA family protein
MFSLIGVIYLPPLPGAGNSLSLDMDDLVAHAVRDAQTLSEAGFDAALVSNAHDAPLTERVPIEEAAAIAVIANEVRRATDLRLGVDVEHNDGAASAAIAGAARCDFVRVKVLTGAAVGPSGIMQGCAEAVGRVRRSFVRPIEVLADVQETTSVNLSFADPVSVGRQHLQFGGADGLVYTSDEGADVALARIAEMKEALGEDVKILIGGRANMGTIRRIREGCDGAIVATSVRTGGAPSDYIDLELARALAQA